MLLILTDDGAERREDSGAHTFDSRDVTIGRVEANDLQLAAVHISSRHARIRYASGRYVFTDLGSTNGSVVMRGQQRILLGEKGQPEVALESGDLLVLGDIADPVRLRVDIRRAPAGRGSTLAAGGNTIVASRSRQDSLIISQRLNVDHAALQILFRQMSAMNSKLDRDQILDRVAEAALEAIPGAVDALVVVSDGGPDLVVKAEAHRGAPRIPDARICQQVLDGDRALLFGQHDASTLPAETLVSQGVGSGIAAPLWGDQRALGVLQINCEPGRFELDEVYLDLAVLLAHHAATALERAALIARLRAAERQLKAENRLLRRRTQPEVEMVAGSPAMARVVDDLTRAASTDVTVLLQGETGTGKEVAARFVHESSGRRGGLMVPVNCGALTEHLLDSELFGHRKGAFTGAATSRKGVFEVAAGGSVFLDEIGETPAALQIRLLRVLEEGKIKVVGESVERRVDVRIIAATNRDLARQVTEGRFRQDLFYRLRVFPVVLPPLRERPEDIGPLCELFAARFSRKMGREVGGIDPGLIAALKRHAFPGNIRELANEIERMIVRSDPGAPLTSDMLPEDLFPAAPPLPPSGAGGRSLREQLADLERQIISDVVTRNEGRKVAAARELGLSRQGLSKKMERLGLRTKAGQDS